MRRWNQSEVSCYLPAYLFPCLQRARTPLLPFVFPPALLKSDGDVNGVSHTIILLFYVRVIPICHRQPNLDCFSKEISANIWTAVVSRAIRILYQNYVFLREAVVGNQTSLELVCLIPHLRQAVTGRVMMSTCEELGVCSAVGIPCVLYY
jgi:hypothetical protein